MIQEKVGDVDNMEDNDIVELINKSKYNFHLLTKKYKNKLKRYIKHISFFNDEEVEDILQDVFIKVYVKLNSFDSSMKFSSWIYRIVHNETVDRIRKNKNRTKDISIDNDEIEIVLKSEENIEENLITKENIDKIKKAINELPKSYKEVLILRYLEERSYEEIGDILQKPKGTIAALINKGRKIIQANIKL